MKGRWNCRNCSSSKYFSSVASWEATSDRTQQSLANASVHDFAILEYRDTIGGRAWHKPFGKDKDGKPYIIEMGANWVCHETCDMPVYWQIAYFDTIGPRPWKPRWPSKSHMELGMSLIFSHSKAMF